MAKPIIHNRQPTNYDNRPTRNPNPPTTRNQWPSRTTNTNTRPTRSNNTYCYYCNIPGHDTKDCRKLSRFLREHNVLPQNNNTPVVNYTTPHPTATTPSWMWDTGASNNTANNNQQFPVLSEYGGPDKIVLSDGKTLPITHIAQTTIPTKSRPLLLNNILIAPNLRNNLISVAKVCRTNRVSVEFFPYHFFVKDLRTGARLMRGVNINDVYYGPISLSPQVNNTQTNSLLMWHHILGPPSLQVFKSLISRIGLHSNKVTRDSFHCASCSLNKSHKLPFGKNSFVANQPLQLLYSDVWGPVKTSISGFKY
ncbi:putative RNA-directed DNA polymerase [Helianthus annuus]|nr:putative RNA-directed DNA polymerase [Helianthus annuus]